MMWFLGFSLGGNVVLALLWWQARRRYRTCVRVLDTASQELNTMTRIAGTLYAKQKAEA